MFNRRAWVVGFVLLLIIGTVGCSGGGSSSSSLAITSISVSTATAGSSATGLTVTGTGFGSNSVVQWQGTALPTTFVSSTQLTTTIPASNLTTAGTFSITVKNGSTTSNSVSFAVTAGGPTISVLTPSSVTAGTTGFVLNVTGTGYNSSAVVRWNGTDLTTTFVNATQLNATVPASFIAGSAAVSITVTTTGTNAGTSSALTFAVNGPSPSISSMNPMAIYAGSGDTLLTVSGSGFISNSVINVAGTDHTTVYSGPSQVTTVLTSTELASAGNLAVLVKNASPGGGQSNALNLAVTAAPAAQPPVANAGVPQTVALASVVTLDGSGSTATSGNRLAYSWSLISVPTGSTAALANPTSVKPTFTADRAGNYIARLTVNDGSASTPSDVVISTINSAPVADAGVGQTVLLGQDVRLIASRSSDVDGNPLTYNWSLITVPSGSTAAVTNPTSPLASFTPDKAGTYVAKVTVGDGSANSSATVTFSTANTAPVADAGRDQSFTVGTLVHLDGRGASDVDGDPLSYRWSLISVPTGSNASLSGRNVAAPSFTLDRAGYYVAQLIVNDGKADSAPATVTIASTLNSPPIAFAGRNQTVAAGSTVQLDGSHSTDVNGNPLSYRWAIISRPSGSSALLTSTNSIRSSFTADVAGTYIAQLVVNDSAVDSKPSTVTISTVRSGPVANAGTSQVVESGSAIQLDGTGSTDVDGNALTYRWALVSKPALSGAYLSDTSTPNPIFIADKDGEYVAQLIVNDGTTDSVPSTVLVSTTFAKPIAVAGNPQTAAVGATVQLDGSGSTNPNSGTLSYQWSMLKAPAGSAVYGSPTTPNPTFVPDLAGDYVFQLIVNDGTVSSDPATVTISTVSSPPIANATGSESGNIGSTVNLDGSGSSSPDGRALTHKWALLYRPAGSAAALSSQTSATPTLTLDKRGPYVAQLIVNDGIASSLPVTHTITTISQAPVANAGSTQSVSTGNSVTLDGSGSTDPDGYPLSYQWSFTSIPTGSVAKLSSPNTSSPTFIPDVAGTYTVQLVVSDGELSSAPATVTITADQNTQISFTPSPVSMSSNGTAILAVSIPSPAGTSGLTITLTSSDTSVATVPASVTIASGSTSVTFAVTSAAVAGTTKITGSATGYSSGSVDVKVTTRTLTWTNVTVGKDLQVATTLALGVAAPSGGVDVKLTSSDPAKVVLSATATSAGSGSITIHIGANSLRSQSIYVQGLSTGTSNIAIEATGYDNAAGSVTVVPSGFIVTSGSTINTTTISADTNISVAAAALDPTTLQSSAVQGIRAGLAQVSLTLNNDTPATGTLTTNPVIFKPLISVVTTAFHPVAAGSTNIKIATPAGFTEPSQLQSIGVTVNVPAIKFSGDLTVGRDLQAPVGIYLSTGAPTGGATVTVTSSDASKLLLSTNPTVAGTESVNVYISEGSLGQPVVYMQSLADSGTVTLTAKTAQFADSTTSVNLVPSGFVITSGDISTLVSAGDTAVRVAAAKLQPGTLAYLGSQVLRAGTGPVSVAVGSSNTAVGTIATSPVVFNQNVSGVNTAFHPVATGITTLSLTTPAGFSTPANYQSVNAAVTAGSMTTNVNVVTGKDLQTSSVVSLGTTPPTPVSVTITSSNTGVAVVSSGATRAGGAAVIFDNVSGTTPQFYIQGLAVGTTTLTVQAPGYTDVSVNVTVNPSGFVMGIGDFATTVGAADVEVPVAPAVLDPSSYNFVAYQPLRPGMTVDVGVSSSSTSVGTIGGSVTLTNNQPSASTPFHAVAKGTTNLSVAVPAGFSTPAQYRTIVATVQ